MERNHSMCIVLRETIEALSTIEYYYYYYSKAAAVFLINKYYAGALFMFSLGNNAGGDGTATRRSRTKNSVPLSSRLPLSTHLPACSMNGIIL